MSQVPCVNNCGESGDEGHTHPCSKKGGAPVAFLIQLAPARESSEMEHRFSHRPTLTPHFSWAQPHG